MKVPFSPPDIGEAEISEVIDTLRSGWITTGPKTKLFEKMISEYCGTDTTVCLNSATAALELTLRFLGIKEGDEVITCAYTYTASASVIAHVGAKIVLADCQKDSFEMDYSALSSAITDKTKAVIVVDVAGKISDYDKVYEIVNAKKELFVPNTEAQKTLGRIAVISDSAHAFGSQRNNKKAGCHADFTAFSFHAVKNLTTGEGGALTFNKINGFDNDKMYRLFQLMSLHGQSKDAYAKTIGNWEYDIVAPYYKCNMTDIMASLGIAQLKRYDKSLARRHDIVKKYNEAFSGLDISVLAHEGEGFKTNGHIYMMRINGADEQKRNKFIKLMAENEIATNVHFKPLPLHTAYKDLGFDIKDFPNSYDYFKNEVTLPLNACITDEQVDAVIRSVKECLNKLD